MTSKEFGKILQDKLTSEYGVELNVASNQQIYRSLALICRQMMSENYKKFQSKAIGTGTKQVYYLCMEFLMGRSLKMSLFNLGLDEVAKKALADADIALDSIFEEEPDAGLGNGGLGRLAACYLDGMATTGVCGTGYPSCNEYGIFATSWTAGSRSAPTTGRPAVRCVEEPPGSGRGGPLDGEIRGELDNGFHYIQHTKHKQRHGCSFRHVCAGLRRQGRCRCVWVAGKGPDFDMSSFSLGNYNTAMSKNANAELISKVLYPQRQPWEGRSCACVSSTSRLLPIGDIAEPPVELRHAGEPARQGGHPAERYPPHPGHPRDDAHPWMSAAFGWDKAFDICQKVFSYTNHTLSWPRL